MQPGIRWASRSVRLQAPGICGLHTQTEGGAVIRGICSVTTLPGPSWLCHSLAVSPRIRNLTCLCRMQTIKVPSYGVVVKIKVSSVKSLDRAWHEANTMICWLKLNSCLEVLPKSQIQLNFIFPTQGGVSRGSWIFIILLHISPFAFWQTPPRWSAFRRSFPCLSSVPHPTPVCTAHSQRSRAIVPSSVDSSPPSVDAIATARSNLKDWHGRPMTPRRSHAEPPPILPLIESKPSLSESLRISLRPSLSQNLLSDSAFLWQGTSALTAMGDYGSSVRVFTPLKTSQCSETWIACYTNSFSLSQRYTSYWGLK